MRINYKKELEEAAKNMILVHKPHTLIRIILRTLVRKVRVAHAGILLYERSRNSYIVTVTRGELGTKIPAGLVRLDPHSPIIRFFTMPEYGPVMEGGALSVNRIKVERGIGEEFGNADTEYPEKILKVFRPSMRHCCRRRSIPCSTALSTPSGLRTAEVKSSSNSSPALSTSNLSPAICFKNASAIWLRAELVHINDLIQSPKKLDNYQIIAFPGGFSYGDDTGSGNALARKIKNHLNVPLVSAGWT